MVAFSTNFKESSMFKFDGDAALEKSRHMEKHTFANCLYYFEYDQSLLKEQPDAYSMLIILSGDISLLLRSDLANIGKRNTTYSRNSNATDNFLAIQEIMKMPYH